AVGRHARRQACLARIALEEALHLELPQAALVVGLAAGEEKRATVQALPEVAAQGGDQVAGQRVFLPVAALRSGDADAAATEVEILQHQLGYLGGSEAEAVHQAEESDVARAGTSDHCPTEPAKLLLGEVARKRPRASIRGSRPAAFVPVFAARLHRQL